MAYFDFTAGQPLLASQLDSAFGNAGWTAYTPTMTNVTVGNGTFSCAYVQVGKTMTVRFKFTMGSTSSVTGTFTASLPGDPTSYAIASAYIADASGSDYPAQALMSGNTFTIRVSNSAGTFAVWAAANSTTPVVPAVNDVYTATIIYQVT